MICSMNASVNGELLIPVMVETSFCRRRLPNLKKDFSKMTSLHP